jgi:hypothetical protein
MNIEDIAAEEMGPATKAAAEDLNQSSAAVKRRLIPAKAAKQGSKKPV